ncbi:MAG: DUF3990 domain-containing protein [Bifidobacteriaceae bacterium]|jgi:hypothetical protein|nr:DUF3990 domain-containing protein [Bifidobacteriaceae bacterium]
MRLFHGSNLQVATPVLIGQQRGLDFGPGFYTTSNPRQARAFARSVVRRAGNGVATVSEYDFDAELAQATLSVKRFVGPDLDWLDFVLANRGSRGGSDHSFDLVVGPVADDDVFAVLQAYEAGFLDRVQTLAALQARRLYDQYVFTTLNGLGWLRFVEAAQEGAR